MYRFVAAVSMSAMLLTTAVVRADDAAKKIVDQAVIAHGGAEMLAKLKGKAVIQKGKMSIAALEGTEATLEAFAADKKFKQVVKLSLNGMDIEQVVCYDGKEMWIAVMGKVAMTLSKKEELAMIEDAIHAEEAAGLVLLGDKTVELSIIGDTKVGEFDCVAIKVSKKDRKDVSLHFEKKTHLLRKIENRAIEFQTQTEVNQERIISEYKDVDGMKRAHRVTVQNDGKKVVEIEFTEIKFVDKLDADTFDKPK